MKAIGCGVHTVARLLQSCEDTRHALKEEPARTSQAGAPSGSRK